MPGCCCWLAGQLHSPATVSWCRTIRTDSAANKMPEAAINGQETEGGLKWLPVAGSSVQRELLSAVQLHVHSTATAAHHVRQKQCWQVHQKSYGNEHEAIPCHPAVLEERVEAEAENLQHHTEPRAPATTQGGQTAMRSPMHMKVARSVLCGVLSTNCTQHHMATYRRSSAVECLLVGDVACRTLHILQELGQASVRCLEQPTAALKCLCTCY
jgi:hypothetical protein